MSCSRSTGRSARRAVRHEARAYPCLRCVHRVMHIIINIVRDALVLPVCLRRGSLCCASIEPRTAYTSFTVDLPPAGALHGHRWSADMLKVGEGLVSYFSRSSAEASSDTGASARQTEGYLGRIDQTRSRGCCSLFCECLPASTPPQALA